MPSIIERLHRHNCYHIINDILDKLTTLDLEELSKISKLYKKLALNYEESVHVSHTEVVWLFNNKENNQNWTLIKSKSRDSPLIRKQPNDPLNSLVFRRPMSEADVSWLNGHYLSIEKESYQYEPLIPRYNFNPISNSSIIQASVLNGLDVVNLDSVCWLDLAPSFEFNIEDLKSDLNTRDRNGANLDNLKIKVKSRYLMRYNLFRSFRHTSQFKCSIILYMIAVDIAQGTEQHVELLKSEISPDKTLLDTINSEEQNQNNDETTTTTGLSRSFAFNHYRFYRPENNNKELEMKIDFNMIDQFIANLEPGFRCDKMKITCKYFDHSNNWKQEAKWAFTDLIIEC